MPLYEYECESCGEQFEVMQKFSDEPLTRHEKCGGSVHRLISAPALQFKGSGWYITDYAKGGKTGDNGAGKKADAPAGESSGGSSKSEGSSSESSSGTKTETKSKSSDTK